MPGAFDPYHTWLGIPPAEQPPNHYRLLGLPPFEDQPEAIEHAADQRMSHLHALQTGKHGRFADRLLGEVGKARVCLLSPQKKAAYDRQLRETLQVSAAADVPKPPPAPGELPRQRTVTYRPESPGGKPAGEPTGESAVLGRLGEYELLERLGKGGMGTVYKARHTKLKRVVALKVLPKGRREDDQAIARFEREMEAVGRLDHPNVVRAHDAREIEGTRFLVMEHVEGLDLGKVVRRLGPLPVADACELIRQAALGLESAHQHGLVHRDVKPSNLMLTARGEVKLLDLGLARFQSDQPAGEEMTRTGQAMGTLDYMAPEQVSDTHSVDIRADIYALGCTLYKLLTGQAPFSGPQYESAFDKMQGHLEKPVPPIRRFRADAPKGLIAVVNRMLAKDPAGRFATPAEVADAVGPLGIGSDLPGLLAQAQGKPPVVRPSRSLEATAGSQSSGLTRFLERVKIKPPPPPPGTEQHRWARPAIIIGSAAVGVLLLAILIVWAVKSRSGPAEAATALVFDWPQSEREETTVLIGRRRFLFPASGPLTVRCRPGEYQIRAVRDGFEPNEKRVTVSTGKREKVPAFDSWIPLEKPAEWHLALKWPEAERTDTKLEIDGQARDISTEPIERTLEDVRIPLEPGSHTLWIARRGFEPFEKDFTIVDGEDTTIEVRFIAGGPGPPPPEPSEKLPVPAEDVQQKIAGQIDQTHGVASAKTAAEKLELAGKLLTLGRQPGENSDERFVLLRKVMELATQGGDAALMLEAMEVLGAGFDVDLPAERQQAITQFVRTATPPPRAYSLIEADRFAQSTLRSPKIASLVQAADQVAVGDAYWGLAQTEKGETRAALMLSAADWYEQAQSDAGPGALKDKLTSRLNETAQIKAAVQQAQQDAEKKKRYAEALRPAETMVAAWDFRGATAALAKLRFEEQDLAARLAARRDELQRMAALKAKMIAKINTAKPPLQKSALMLRGINADVAGADEVALTAGLKNGKVELHPWQDLSGQSSQKLLELVVDRDSADDHLAAGLLALVFEDASLAEKLFEQARSSGAQIDPYLARLAAAAFTQATEFLKSAELLMGKQEFAKAGREFSHASSLLTEIRNRYVATSWFGSNKATFETAWAKARAGVQETEAENLYAEAAKLFDEEEFFDLKPLVEKLEAAYGTARPVTDTQRKPSFAEMVGAVADLGKFITVRQDGKGDYKSIQEAVNEAPIGSLIEIQDNGPYGNLEIPKFKAKLTIRGGKGCRPILTSLGVRRKIEGLVVANAFGTTLKRLVLINNGRTSPSSLVVAADGFRLHSSMMFQEGWACWLGQEHEFQDCIILAGIIEGTESRAVLRNCLFTRELRLQGPEDASCELRFCTVLGKLRLAYPPVEILDSIIGEIENIGKPPDNRLDYCAMFVEPPPTVKPGKGSFRAAPMFRDPMNLDFRLSEKSPCRGKASDGGDLGVRYTPEMIEMLKLALELRQRGLIKF